MSVYMGYTEIEVKLLCHGELNLFKPYSNFNNKGKGKYLAKFKSINSIEFHRNLDGFN